MIETAWLLLWAMPAAASIQVIHPREGMTLSRGEGKFITGSVSDPKALFTINGQTVTAHSNGAFLAWVPVQPGLFTFELRLALKDGTTSFRRAVNIPPLAPALAANPLAIDQESLSPREDLELRPGDWLLTRMKASPGQKARFRLHKRPWQPMWESNPSLGVYEGSLLLGPDDAGAPAPVEFQVGEGRGAKTAQSLALIGMDSGTPPVAVVRSSVPVWIHTAPGQGNYFLALPGTRLLTAGREGPEIKVKLAAGLGGSIEAKHLELLPAGAHPPRAVTDSITMRPSEESTIVRIALSDRVPFVVEESFDLRSLTARLHYTVADTEWMVYRSTDPMVDEIRLVQESSDIAAVTVVLKPRARLWGYQARFESGSLVLELKRPPRLAAPPSSPLKGVRIFLDPGHNPSQPGGIGPLGTREVDVNYQIARAAESLLLKEGAVPLLSRESPEAEVPLADRPRMAVDRKADLFISIHNNNLNENAHPFKSPYGFSTFYYHPHSLALARDVHAGYQRSIPLPDEQVRFGDLLIPRMTEMPSILTESAYMTFPEQEELLLKPRFRQKLAETIVDGLRSHLRALRERQEPEAPAQAKASAAPPRAAPAPAPAKPKSNRKERRR